MPNNGNNYRIRSELLVFLKDLPSLRITHTESVAFINVEIKQIQDPVSFGFFSRWRTYFSHNNQFYLVDQLFKELEKDQIDNDELKEIGSLLKKYFQVLKLVDVNHTYYAMTPGMTIGLFIILHLNLLCFPASNALIYASLLADFYSLGFWLFSIWSFSKYGHVLRELENQLIGKINFLKSLSFLQIDSCYSGSSSSLLPTYSDVLLEDAISMRIPSSTFFHSPVINDEYNVLNNTSDIQEADLALTN